MAHNRDSRVERVIAAANYLLENADELNAALGTAKTLCLFCDAYGYDSHEGIIHTATCPIFVMRQSLTQLRAEPLNDNPS